MSGSTVSETPSDGDAPPPLSAVVADADGVDPPAVDSAAALSPGRCRICGLDGPVWPIRGTNGVFSDAFTSDRALSHGDGVCWRCEHLSNQMDYRRYHWLATASDGITVLKERPELLDVLLNPPEEPWLLKYKDESDFLTVLNCWLFCQQLNTGRDRYRILVDKEIVRIDREAFADMVAFARELRDRDDAPAKRTLLGPVTAADLARYDITRADAERIETELMDRPDWRVAVQLVQ